MAHVRSQPVDGQSADAIWRRDWTETPLGGVSAWPRSLRVTVDVMLNCCRPMCVAWGDELITLYNDAYGRLLGSGPDTLGKPFAELWAHAWPVVGPVALRARGGEAGYVEDLPVTVDQRGYPEHTWWTFSFSSIDDDTGRVGGILCVAHETTREIEGRAALSVERERFARLFDQAPGFLAYLSGPNHIYELANQPRLHENLVPDRHLVGKSVREAFPDLEGQGFFERLDQVYQSGEAYAAHGQKIVFGEGADQREHYISHVYQPVRDEAGSVVGVFVVGHDVTEQVKATVALREREARLRLALDAGRMAVWDVDVERRTVAPSPELNRMLGLPLDARPSLDEVHAQYFPGEFERVVQLTLDARERGDRFIELEYRHVRPDNGEVRWFLLRAMTGISEESFTRSSFGVLMDNTERKEAEERLKLLALEVDHRANNLLASVQSVVALTRADDVAAFRENVLGRISALAHAHRLLAASRWTGAKLIHVVQEELQAFMAGRRVRLEGPDASLSPAVAQGLAVALHELVTNAVKHGALSTEGGRISVTWGRPDHARCVEMTWVERGGPATHPPARSGFGTKLLRRALSGSIAGSVELDWRPEGLCCRLRIPVL